MSSFAEALRAYQQKSARSQRAVALAAGLDPGRYSRLLTGERPPASREQVVALAGALRLSPAQTDHLAGAAGYLPPRLEQVGIEDPAVAALLAALSDPTLSEAARGALRQTIIALTAHWHDRRAGGR